MTKALRVTDYLSHILEAIERIDRYTENLDEAGFSNNELVQDAVIRNIEIIGEASRQIQRADADFASRHTEIPWMIMYAMRNRVSHGYHAVDLEVVWKTIVGDLPGLYDKIQKAFANISVVER